jgi:CRISPR system Cascade subunit CasA
MYCCNGFKYDTYKNGFPAEPTAAVRKVTKKDKKKAQTEERRVVKADPTKALWRELSALLIKRSADGLGGPLAMENAPRDTAFDFHVCAMTREQASMDNAIESVFHITPAFQFNLPTYQGEVMKAENYSRKLRWAVEGYRSTLDNDWEPRIQRTQAKDQAALKNRLAQTALLSYWTTVEKQLPLLMTHIEAIGTEAAIPTRKAWRKMLFSAACEAYKVACGQETPRQMRAFAKGWQKLTKKTDKSESNSLDIKEVNDELAS